MESYGDDSHVDFYESTFKIFLIWKFYFLAEEKEMEYLKKFNMELKIVDFEDFKNKLLTSTNLMRFLLYVLENMMVKLFLNKF